MQAKRALAVCLVIAFVGHSNIRMAGAVRPNPLNVLGSDASHIAGNGHQVLVMGLFRRMLRQCFSSIGCPLPTVPTDTQPTIPAIRTANPADLLKEGVRVAKLRVASEDQGSTGTQAAQSDEWDSP